MMISHLHHINFIVRDLAAAVERYEALLGSDHFIYDNLDKRGVKTARIKVGQTWLVLVEPTDKTGEPALHLEKYGEGFFLMSLATDNIDLHLNEISPVSRDLFTAGSSETRNGLENWTVKDLASDAFYGAQLQLTQERKTSISSYTNSNVTHQEGQ